MGNKKHYRFSFRKSRQILILKLRLIKDRIESFLRLPKCYSAIIRSRQYTKSRLGIWLDLLELYFRYKIPPESYFLCWLWCVPRSNWKYYFGSNYGEPQRTRLEKSVQPSKYQILFADKDICERLCRSMGIRVPITLGIVRPDQNYKEKISRLLEQSAEHIFVIKPIIGGGGRGIVLAKKYENNIVIQSKSETIGLDKFNLSDTVLLQEAIRQDKRMSVFSSYSVNTIRAVTMYTKKDFVIIIAALFRCGVGESYVDNWSAGGVAIGIDVETGKLQKFGYDKNGNRYTEHPTSKVKFENFVIPEWTAIVNLSKKIQMAFPCYRILGLDIALQEGGEPVLIEINEAPDLLGQEQMSGPILKLERNLRAFGEYDLLINKYQRELYRNLLGRERSPN